MASVAAVVRLEVPAKSPYVAVVRLAIAALARETGLEEEVADDLKIAVSEACTNAVLSNERSAPALPVSLLWSAEEGRIVIEVGDRGVEYEPSSVDGTDTQTLRMALSVELMKSLVDVCEIGPRDDGGMFTRLILNR